jgi:histidine triad (HIT) family protein
MADCIFCKIIEGAIPAHKILDSEKVVAILDINPVAPGHTLVLPRVHHEKMTDLPGDLAQELIARAQDVARAVLKISGAEGFNLLSNNHRCAGQAIPHVHFHVIPRKTGDGIRFNWAPTKYKDGEMEKWATDIQKALGS